MHGEQTRHQALQTGLQSLKWSERFWGLGFHTFRVSILLIQRYVQAASPLDSFEVIPQSPSLSKRMKYKNTSILKRVEEKFWEKKKHITFPGFSQLSGKLIYVRYCVLPLFRFPPMAFALFVPACILFIGYFQVPKLAWRNSLRKKSIGDLHSWG